jgi:chromosome condensin MukBEF MukE localization factor
MLSMILIATAVAAFGIFEALAYRYGADSRPGFDERPEDARRRGL